MTLNLLHSDAGRLGEVRLVCTVKFMVKIVCYELIFMYLRRRNRIRAGGHR